MGINCDGDSAGNQSIRNQIVNAETGIRDRGNNYYESNFLVGCALGVQSGPTTKLRFNTTMDCTTSFTGGGVSLGASDN